MARSAEIERAEQIYRGWAPRLEHAFMPVMRSRVMERMAGAAPVRWYFTARIDTLRKAFDGITSSFTVPEDASFQFATVAGVPLTRVSTPGAVDGRLVVHFHGGGYVLGSAHAYREVAARISRAAQATVVLVDFRRAPEHPFPAAIDDTVAVVRQLVADGANPAHIVLSGDSAGGGLVLSTLVALRRAGGVLPAAAVLMSPLIDLAATGESIDQFAGTDPIVNRAMVLMMGALYRRGAPLPISPAFHLCWSRSARANAWSTTRGAWPSAHVPAAST